MKKVLLSLVVLCLLAGSAKADIKFSTSATNADAGSNLNMQLGDSASLYVFVSTAAGKILRGVNINILSSDASVLQATSHVIDNPGGRWTNVSPGNLGDLVTNANALDFFGTSGGVGTSGLNDFVLFSTITFDATSEGTTNLSFTEGNNKVVYRGNELAWPGWTIGSGSVTVSAVPEPNAALATGLIALAGGALRRRRR